MQNTLLKENFSRLFKYAGISNIGFVPRPSLLPEGDYLVRDLSCINNRNILFVSSIIIKYFFSLLFFFILGLFLISCSSPLKVYSRTQFLMGTVVEIKAVSDNSVKADRAISAAFKIMREVENQMTAKRSGSWLDRISKEAVEKPLKIPEELAEVIYLCLKYSEITNGAFDISIGSITRYWEFGKVDGKIPSKEEVENALNLVDFKKIHMDKEKRLIKLDIVGMNLDLGAAAKGYAVDKAVEKLKGMGIDAGLVNAGGDLKVFGKKPDGESWHIGIQDPQDLKEVIGSIVLNDEALVTSGDYERFIIFEGIKYHHILDPKTGWPARDCKSVSIACEKAVEADILSTAVFVMGAEKGRAFLEKLPHVEGMIIDSAGNIYVSSGWKDLLKLKKDRRP